MAKGPIETPSVRLKNGPDQAYATLRAAIVEARLQPNQRLVESDLINISIIQAGNMGISSLAGLEKCESLASLEAGRNDISDLSSLKAMDRLHFSVGGQRAHQGLSFGTGEGDLGGLAFAQYAPEDYRRQTNQQQQQQQLLQELGSNFQCSLRRNVRPGGRCAKALRPSRNFRRAPP